MGDDNKFELVDGGYEGSDKHFGNVHQNGSTLKGAVKSSQMRAGDDFAAQSKGNLGQQAHNGSIGTANTLEAAGSLHAANASNGSQFLRQSMQHEDNNAQSQSTESNAVDSFASDLMKKINHS